MMEVLHVVLTRRLQVQQHWRIAAHAIKRLEVHFKTHPARDRCQMHDTVGRTTNCEQHSHRVFKGFFRQNLVDRQTLARDLDRQGTAALGYADTVSRHGRWRSTPWHGHTKRFCNTGHRARGPHHRTGSDTGHELAVHIGDFFGVDFLGAELTPVSTTICTGTHTLATMRARQHRARDQLHGR